MSLGKRWNLLERKPILERGRKEIVFVRGANLSQEKKKILEINPNSCLFFEKRTYIKTDLHLE